MIRARITEPKMGRSHETFKRRPCLLFCYLSVLWQLLKWPIAASLIAASLIAAPNALSWFGTNLYATVRPLETTGPIYALHAFPLVAEP